MASPTLDPAAFPSVRPPPTARDALGMPAPPPWATRAALFLRGQLERVHDGLVPPFQLVLERLFGLIDNQALHAAVELGLAERLHAGPRTASELAAETGADADALARLLRHLVARGFFAREGERWSNNAASDVLRGDHPFSFRDWVLFFGSSWNVQVWTRLAERVRAGRSACEAAHGAPFFRYVQEKNPEAGRAFDGAMAAGSRIQALLFADTIDLSPVATICDVGGGTGSVLAHLLRVNPHLRGTVLDLPSLAERARATFDEVGVSERATFEGGDFFEAVPPGRDVYTLFAVIHDWDDEKAAKLLATIRRALPPGGRIMVVEGVVPSHDRADFRKPSDLLMLVLSEGGRERTREELAALWARAGLRERRVHTLPSLFLVFELAPE